MPIMLVYVRAGHVFVSNVPRLIGTGKCQHKWQLQTARSFSDICQKPSICLLKGMHQVVRPFGSGESCRVEPGWPDLFAYVGLVSHMAVPSRPVRSEILPPACMAQPSLLCFTSIQFQSGSQIADAHHITTLPFSRCNTAVSSSSSSNSGRPEALQFRRQSRTAMPVSITDAEQRAIMNTCANAPWRLGRCQSAQRRPFNERSAAHSRVFSQTRAAMQHIPTEQDRFGRWVDLVSCIIGPCLCMAAGPLHLSPGC